MPSKGYLNLTSPEGVKEFDTLRCVHCGGIIVMDKKQLGYCGNCAGSICHRCDVIGKCIPMEKMLEKAEARAVKDNQLKRLGII